MLSPIPSPRPRAQTTQTSPRASPRGGGTPATQGSPPSSPPGPARPRPQTLHLVLGVRQEQLEGKRRRKRKEGDRCAVSRCTTATSFYAPATLRQVQQTAASPSPSPAISPPTAAPISSWDKRTGGGPEGVPWGPQEGALAPRAQLQQPRVPASLSRFILATRVQQSGFPPPPPEGPPKEPRTLQPSHPAPHSLSAHRTGAESPGAASSLPPPASWGTQGPASAVLHPLCQQGCPRPRSQTMGTMRPLPALVYPFPPRPGPVPLPRHRETLPQEGGK